MGTWTILGCYIGLVLSHVSYSLEYGRSLPRYIIGVAFNSPDVVCHFGPRCPASLGGQPFSCVHFIQLPSGRTSFDHCFDVSAAYFYLH